MQTLEIIWVILFVIGAWAIYRHPKIVVVIWLLALARWKEHQRRNAPTHAQVLAKIDRLERELDIGQPEPEPPPIEVSVRTGFYTWLTTPKRAREIQAVTAAYANMIKAATGKDKRNA